MSDAKLTVKQLRRIPKQGGDVNSAQDRLELYRALVGVFWEGPTVFTCPHTRCAHVSLTREAAAQHALYLVGHDCLRDCKACVLVAKTCCVAYGVPGTRCPHDDCQFVPKNQRAANARQSLQRHATKVGIHIMHALAHPDCAHCLGLPEAQREEQEAILRGIFARRPRISAARRISREVCAFGTFPCVEKAEALLGVPVKARAPKDWRGDINKQIRAGMSNKQKAITDCFAIKAKGGARARVPSKRKREADVAPPIPAQAVPARKTRSSTPEPPPVAVTRKRKRRRRRRKRVRKRRRIGGFEITAHDRALMGRYLAPTPAQLLKMIRRPPPPYAVSPVTGRLPNLFSFATDLPRDVRVLECNPIPFHVEPLHGMTALSSIGSQ